LTEIPPGPAWPPAGPQPEFATATGPAPILVGFADPVPQRRATVFFRIILLIPHAIALWAIGIAAEVIAVIGWFAALFTGRLPQFAADFLTGYLRWLTRYNAYYLLLTDQYPPFSLDDVSYPVRVAVRPGRLNRLAVLFRFILGIPALIVGSLVGFGLALLSLFIIWLIVLFTGTMPVAAHRALSAVARYSARFSGYMLLLTSEYPKGLFGDTPEAPTAGGAFADPEAAGAGPGVATPPSAEPLTSPPPTESAMPPPAAPPMPTMPPPAAPTAPIAWPDQGPAGFEPSTAPYPAGSWAGPGAVGSAAAVTSWRLVLPDAAKRLMTLFLGLGVVGLAGYVVLIVVVTSSGVSNAVTRQNAIRQVEAYNSTLGTTLSPFASQTAACRTSQDVLGCVTGLDRKVGRAFDTFASGVQSTDMPSGAASSAASRLAADATQAGKIFQRLGSATSAAQYQSIVSSSNLQQIVNQVGTDYQNLGTALNAG
jgi:hypothetical protein